MKNTLLLLLLFTGIVKGQIVNIPDANFKNVLVNTNCVDIDADFVGDVDADIRGTRSAARTDTCDGEGAGRQPTPCPSENARSQPRTLCRRTD